MTAASNPLLYLKPPMVELLAIAVASLSALLVLPKLRGKLSTMEGQLDPQSLEKVKKLDKPLKIFQRISNIIIIATVVIILLFILYLLAMLLLMPR